MRTHSCTDRQPLNSTVSGADVRVSPTTRQSNRSNDFSWFGRSRVRTPECSMLAVWDMDAVSGQRGPPIAVLARLKGAQMHDRDFGRILLAVRIRRLCVERLHFQLIRWAQRPHTKLSNHVVVQALRTGAKVILPSC